MRKAIIVLALLVTAPAAGEAPAGGAGLTGVVRDQSGAAVPGAKVTLVDSTKHQVRSLTSGPAGTFEATGLDPGTYELRIEQPGFDSFSRRVTVRAGTPAAVRVVLSLAKLRQEIRVEGSGTRVSTEAGENMDMVQLDRKVLDRLPVLGNDIIGAAAQFLDSSALGAGGASLVVDGMETSEKGVTASAIQEVRINQNPYAAEYARPGKSKIEVITKPGADQYHGALNFLFRDSALDARNAFAGTRPDEQRRIFEGNLTGPLGDGKKASFLISGQHEEEDLQSLVFARTLSGEVRRNFPQPQRDTELNAKVTRQVGARNTIAVRYEITRESIRGNGVEGFSLPETAGDFTNNEHHVYLNYRLTISKRLINEFGLRAGRHQAVTRSRLAGTPRIEVVDAFTAGSGQADSRTSENHLQFTDTALWSRGRHFLKFGMNVPDLSRRGATDRSNAAGTFYFSSLDDYARGAPYSYVVQRGDAHLVFWQKEMGVFAQDDIKVRPNLSLAAGLRYDRQNHLGDHNNLAPRLSLAYSPDRRRRTVLRVGAGIFYDRTGAGPMGDALRFDGRHLLRFVLTNPGYPNPLGPGGSIEAQPISLVRFAPGLRAPYLFQYGLTAERQLQKSLSITAGYTGIRGVKMFRSRDVNAPPPPGYLGRPDPAIGVLRQVESAGRLASHSFEVGLRGSVSRCFTGTVQYLVGRAYNNTGGINSLPANNYDLTGEWSRAPFDVRQRFNVLGVFRPEKLLSLGIKVAANTGSPYSLTTGRDDNRDGQANDRPAGVPRNGLQGPGSATVDLRWSRDFSLVRDKKKKDAEGPALAVAWDAFNVFNRVNYSTVVGNLSSPFFGKPVASKPARRMQLTLEFKF